MTRMISIGLLLTASLVVAQTPPPPPTQGQPTGLQKKAELPPPPAATAVAATVNGQPIPKLAVYRAFIHEPAGYNDAESQGDAEPPDR